MLRTGTGTTFVLLAISSLVEISRINASADAVENFGTGSDRTEIPETKLSFVEQVDDDSLILGFASFDSHLSSSTEIWDEWAVAYAPKRMRDNDKVFQNVTHAAAGGDTEAQYRLGLAYRDGVRVKEKNIHRAVGFIAKAAQKRHPRASFLYGVALAEGVGTGRGKDETEALHHFKRAAKHATKHPHHHYHHTDHTIRSLEQGETGHLGQHGHSSSLVEALERVGSEVVESARDSLESLTRAAADHAERWSLIGGSSESGVLTEWSLGLSAAHNVKVLWTCQAKGVRLSGGKRSLPSKTALLPSPEDQSAKEAHEVKLMRRGAMFHLGDLWEHGRFGTHRDMTLAMEWYEAAAELGHKEARYRLNDLRTQEL